MPANAALMHITVHLDMDINGEPVTAMFSQPASVEPLADTPDGFVVHVHLDGAKLAKAILPHLVDVVRRQTDTRGV